MKILALETSAKAVSAAVVEDGKLLASSYQDSGLTHSRTLMPMVQHLLQNSDLTLDQMDGIAVAQGPGSFTGIRIGVSTAKGLALAADKPVLGVSTLEAMAWNISHLDGLILCAMDARRNQVYNALFQADGGELHRECPDRAISLEELAEELAGDPREKTVVGDGAVLCAEFLRAHQIPCRIAPPHLVMQNAASVGFAAQRAAQAGAWSTSQDLLPVYLRLSQAERERNERLKKEQRA